MDNNQTNQTQQGNSEQNYVFSGKTKICKQCGTIIDARLKVCPKCFKKQPKKAPLIIIGIVVLLVVISIATRGGGNSTQQTSLNNSTNNTDEEYTDTENKKDGFAKNANNDKKEKIESATIGEKNALYAAKNYLDISGFSKKSLIKQLKFEGYSASEAKYAVNHSGADWNEQAGRKAQEYMNISSFSKSGLIKQLKFEGFTEKQAKYGVKKVGY